MSKVFGIADLPKASLSEIHEAPVPGTDGVIQFKLLSVAELKKVNEKRGDDFAFMVDFVARSLVGPDGKPWSYQEAVKAVWDLTGEQAKGLFETINAKQNLTKPQQEAIAKNSEGASGDSSSNSPATSAA